MDRGGEGDLVAGVAVRVCCRAVGGRELLGGLLGLGLLGGRGGLRGDVAGGLRGRGCGCVGSERRGGGLGRVGGDQGSVGHEGLLQVLRAVVGGGGVGLVGGAAEDLLERRGGHLGERVRHRLGGRLRGLLSASLLGGLLGGGRHVGQLLAIRTVQVFTRVIRHAPIVSGSCHLCRHGTRKWVGWRRRKILADVACISGIGDVCFEVTES